MINLVKIGAYTWENRQFFSVWAPSRKKMSVRLFGNETTDLPMHQDEFGYWRAECDLLEPGTRYLFVLDGEVERPDPASHWQPETVHAASQLVDHASFSWSDFSWQSISLQDMVQYELHVGTFTPEGTFEAIIPRLDDLLDLGVNTIELMPVAQFPGSRNWGYDGAYPFAVQHSYGGPKGLKRLVDACHQKGMAVILDVVYNHLGPEGNYLAEFGPYFTDKYQTPWGKAINFDDAHNEGVRNYFFQNALYWARHYHIDALRLDAVHAIYDFSAEPFLKELAEVVRQELVRPFWLIAESDLNDSRLIRPPEQGGYNLHAQWSDDFHHSTHSLLTGEDDGYYGDFGSLSHLAKVLQTGYTYTWDYSSFRQRRHGNSPVGCPASQFVVCTQNHDQVGNRMLGERLSALVDFESLKLAAGLLILSPFVPMLFMGEEYGEDNPFLYFVSHGDPDLVQAVREGRKREFAHFKWEKEPPDPQSEETFNQSKLDWSKRESGEHQILLSLYKELIHLRKTEPALSKPSKDRQFLWFSEEDKILIQKRWFEEDTTFMVYSFNNRPITMQFSQEGKWRKLVDSADSEWNGPGSTLAPQLSESQLLHILPRSFAVYSLEGSRE